MRLLTSCLLLASFAVFSSETAILCGRGFTLVNNRCIRIFPNNLKHREAETDCTYLGGTLVNIKNSIDNRAIATRAANAGIQNVWLGVFCFSSNTTDCYYDDASGAASNFTNFAPGYPQVDGNYGGCVYMTTSNGQWISARCGVIGMPFVCEVPYTIPDDCSHNYNGYCYYPSTELGITSVNMTHDRAQSICASKSMNLVSIHSKMEHDYIRSIYRMSTGPVNVSQIYLGATAFLPDTFDWDDMTNWDFEYMDPLAPHGRGNCLVMDLWGIGLWSEVNCQTAQYFMCKRKAGSTTTTTSPMASESQEPGPQESLRKLQKLDEILKVSSNSDTDFSHCNSSLIMAPGVITSPGYPIVATASGSCTYNLRALGPYKIGIYFTDFSTNSNQVVVYDENHNQLGTWSYDNRPFSVMAPSNIVTISFIKYQFGSNVEHGFSATFIPYS